MFWVRIHCHTTDNMSVNLQNPVVVKVSQNLRASPPHQFLAANGLLNQGHDFPKIFLVKMSNLLVLVRVNHGADSAIAEDFRQKRLVDVSIQQVDPRDPVTTRKCCMLQFRKKTFWKNILLLFEDLLQLRSNQMTDPLPIQDQPVEGRKVDQFSGVQRFGYLDSHQIGV